MTSVFKIGLSHLLTKSKTKLFNSNILCITVQKCNISGKTIRGTDRQKPAPWPYKTKKYGLLNTLFDKTTDRFDDNTKVIVIDGPIAAGKSKLAEKLAAELEMVYIPQSNMDSFYINEYGYDMRQLDSELPESCQSYDVKNFCKNPKHMNTAAFQLRMFALRYSDYFDAITHLLNTGQGVVMNRSVYSDFVFLEAMYKCGFVSKGARSFYYDIQKNTMDELIRPHLVIYLDIGVNEVKKRIAKRGIPYEQNSKAFSDEFLQTMESEYKQKYLKEMSTHCEILVYDWTTYGDAEVVIEDIERIDFGRFSQYDTQLKSWRLSRENEWAEMRMKFTNDKDHCMTYFNVPRFDVPELLVEPYDTKKLSEVWLNAPGMKYIYGYNADMGDKNILTKMGTPKLVK